MLKPRKEERTPLLTSYSLNGRDQSYGVLLITSTRVQLQGVLSWLHLSGITLLLLESSQVLTEDNLPMPVSHLKTSVSLKKIESGFCHL